MNCDTACQQISGWIDGQLRSDEAAALEEHLAACGECQSLAEALRTQNADLRNVFAEHRQAADRVAQSVLQSLAEPALPAAAAPSRSWLHWPSLLLAAAAGFLLAVIIFQPWKEPVQTTASQEAPSATPTPN